VVLGLACALAIGAVFSFVAGMPDEGLDRADKLASVGSVVIGVVALLLGGMALWMPTRHEERKSASAGADEMVRLDRAASRLAEALSS
jgi:drug/metabolite transporter (DMT)-like permease